ncbi:heme A synthase [Brevibacterium luteolum]|uniref:Heme A synthase n=2 Tax=Brevibacterium luteolum TaxID=199591 RepID=A0A6G8L027_9MICO|nr:heme A synthase [Brevibacterium luteolum]
MPRQPNRFIRAVAWIMLLAQSGIIMTGGTVRLTGSGLGCPTWPRCTEDSLTNTPEMGIHGYIEFGNRVLAIFLGLYCIFTLIAVWRMRRTRPEIFWSVIALALIVVSQAVVGGISVRMQLNPWIVASHFVPSAIAVAISAFLLRRTGDAGRPATPLGTPGLRMIGWAIGGLTALVVILGVLVTGAGPHAGDALSARNGFDTVVISRLHAIPVWILVAATIAAVLMARRQGLAFTAKAFTVLLVIELAQGVIGYIQYFTGLPELLVAAHLLGVCFMVAGATVAVDSLYRRPALRDAEPAAPAAENRDAALTASSRMPS